MKSVEIPVNIFRGLDRKTVKRIMDVITDPENQPVFLHCKLGEDRTGVIVAIYRMEADGWPLADAEAEMQAFGFNDIWINLKEFLRSYSRIEKRPGPDLGAQSLTDQFYRDIALLQTYTANIKETMSAIEDEASIFNIKRTRDFDMNEKEKLYSLWWNFLDHIVALDRLGDHYSNFYLLKEKYLSNNAFLLSYAAYITKFSSSLKFIGKTIGNDLYEKKLDDANPDFGIPAGMYAKLKWNTIHVKDVSNIWAGYQYFNFLRTSYKRRGLMDNKKTGWIFGHIDSQYEYVKKELKLKGLGYFAANGLDILKDRTLSAWFPVQKNVAKWMGDTKVKRLNKYLITGEQIQRMDEFLKPGDIIVERRNWYLSNVGLPGFWPHSELYIGTYSDMEDYFDDPSVTAYYRSIGDYGGFMDYLRRKYPQKMRRFLKKAPDGYPHQIIEAVSEGVKFSSLQEAASADYIAVMRPRLSKLDIAKAIDEAFHYLDRPYDYNFDFLTDSALVCSELLYKIYLPGKGKDGLGFRLRVVAGRKILSPNDIVRKFDKEAGTAGQELDFVYFLDGSEKDKKAVVKGEGVFRKTHKRLKWDIVQK